MKVLITGGAGYVGSHAYVALAQAGHQPVIVDNFENASPLVLARLTTLVGQKPVVYEGDVRDEDFIASVLDQESCDAVFHLAGLKAVGDSMADPARYFSYNVDGSQALLNAMGRCGCKKIVFSSSATVYGTPDYTPIDEQHPRRAESVYAETKVAVEDVLSAKAQADPQWAVCVLRYFNPIGAHHSGLIGEDPRGTPNNLMPYVSQVAVGRRAKLTVFGNDYPTPDGTGVRDYVHVSDIADGHVACLGLLDSPGYTAINLGSGRGHSVLEVVAAFERACGRKIAVDITGRRAGDVASYFADINRAGALLGWHAKRDLDTMCADTWRWQSANPEGYV